MTTRNFTDPHTAFSTTSARKPKGMPSSGPPWSSAEATCCSTTWRGRCGASPVFPVFGRRDYQVQPIYAEDLASQAVDVGSGRDSFVADAAGPETFTFEELLRLLASSVGARVRVVHTTPPLGFALTRLVGLMLRDTVLTKDEVDGLMAGLLTSNAVSTATTRLGS